MGTIEQRKAALINEKERLLKSIRECEDKIAQLKQQQNYAVFSSDSSSDEEDPLAESQALSQIPLSTQSKQLEELEGLRTSLQATEELSCVTVLESRVQKLPGPPAGLDMDEEDLPNGEWLHHEAKCNMTGIIPFTISFLLHALPNSLHRFHNTTLRIMKPSLEAEYRPSVQPSLSPSTELVRLRAFARMVLVRRRTLKWLLEKMHGELVLEETEGGVKMTEQRQKLVVLWTFQLENPYSYTFINKSEVTYKTAFDEDMRQEIQELVDALAEHHLSSKEQGKLMLQLLTIMWPDKGAEVNEGTSVPRQVVASQEDDRGSETEVMEDEYENEAEEPAVPNEGSPLASSSRAGPSSKIPVKKK